MKAVGAVSDTDTSFSRAEILCIDRKLVGSSGY